MKAKTKQTLYLILGILGLVLAAVAKFLPAQVWNKTQIEMCIRDSCRLNYLYAYRLASHLG